MSRFGLVDGRMLERLRRFYSSVCTIQHNVERGRTASGQPKEEWVELTGHGDIPCQFAPAGGREIRRPDSTIVSAAYICHLQGHFPKVTEKMRAVIDGTPYDIVLVEHDSQAVQTRLALER